MSVVQILTTLSLDCRKRDQLQWPHRGNPDEWSFHDCWEVFMEIWSSSVLDYREKKSTILSEVNNTHPLVQFLFSLCLKAPQLPFPNLSSFKASKRQTHSLLSSIATRCLSYLSLISTHTARPYMTAFGNPLYLEYSTHHVFVAIFI